MPERSSSLGVQIAPWVSAADVVAAVPTLSTAFDVVWVPDQMSARNQWVLLSAVAASGRIGVAGGVSVALSRNPIDLASAMATLAELVPPDRPLAMGLGAGGSLVSGLFDKRGATGVLAEAIGFVRRMWDGEPVPLGEYPLLGERLGWRPGATARLTFPVPRPIPVFVAVGGARTLAVTDELADGLIGTSTYPPLSYPALRSGSAALDAVRATAGRRAAAGRPLRLVYGLNVCVAPHRDEARGFARRQAALSLGNPALWPTLAEAGAEVDLESARDTAGVLQRTGNVREAAGHVSDALLDGLIVAGTAEDCAARLTDAARLAQDAGFDELYLGAPLGPDLGIAAKLLTEVVAPAVAAARAPRPAGRTGEA